MVHRASKWHPMARTNHMSLPYGTCSSHRTPSTSHVVPYGSHMGNMAPIWLTLLVHTSHMALIRCMWLTYSECGLQAPMYGARCSHIAHMAPMWPSYGTCGSHLVPPHSHMVTSTSNMAHTAPTWHTWIPYAPCHMLPTQRVPSSSNQSISMTSRRYILCCTTCWPSRVVSAMPGVKYL
jgi:hypothetical protein